MNSLAPVYGWFTEGFDTLDLKEAKALLDELRPRERPRSHRRRIELMSKFQDAMRRGSASELDQQARVFAKSWWWRWPENC